MPPPTLLKLDEIDCTRVLRTREQIYEHLPQRYEFMQLDAIVHLDQESHAIAGYRDVRADEWWCRGHLPDRPLFPGVLMMESAAQLAAFYWDLMFADNGFLAFGGVDNAKFRGAVRPPARIVFIGRAVEMRRRRFVCDIQAFVDEAMVFEGTITGLPVQF